MLPVQENAGSPLTGSADSWPVMSRIRKAEESFSAFPVNRNLNRYE